MNHSEIIKAIQFIRPDAEFSLSGDELTWLDKKQVQPTDEEIKAAIVAFKAEQKAEAKTKEKAKQAILDRIGLTADELKTILG